MTSYQWSSELQEAVYSLGTPPKWAPYPLPAVPVLVASTQSPLGPGSFLERCELYIAASATMAPASGISAKHQLASLSMLAIGEVYPTGTAGLPDPRTGTNVPAAITAVAHLNSFYGDSGTDTDYGASWSTDGYVTSHAVRGPAKYGGGTPELRVAVYTPNLFNAFWLGSADTSEVYHVRALWRI